MDKGSTEETRKKLEKIVNNFGEFLKEKNKRYGNSALDPISIFTKHIKEENSISLNGILVRLDDKLSRIKNSDILRKNDVSDIIGYLILLCAQKEWEDFSEFLD